MRHTQFPDRIFNELNSLSFCYRWSSIYFSSLFKLFMQSLRRGILHQILRNRGTLKVNTIKIPILHRGISQFKAISSFLPLIASVYLPGRIYSSSGSYRISLLPLRNVLSMYIVQSVIRPERLPEQTNSLDLCTAIKFLKGLYRWTVPKQL